MKRISRTRAKILARKYERVRLALRADATREGDRNPALPTAAGDAVARAADQLSNAIVLLNAYVDGT